MTKNNYIRITRVVFAAIALMHLLRLLYGWHVTIGAVAIPSWGSVVLVFFAGILALHGFNIVER